MKTSRCRRFAVSEALLLLTLAVPPSSAAQTFANRGFLEGAGVVFPQETANDTTRLVGDLRVRDEVFVKPSSWVQFAGGLDVRANSHEQVDDWGRIDFSDRGARRPPLSVRRLAATLTRGALTVDAGKQFIRWGKTDIVTPTDRFAPRDFLNVVDAEFLAVTGTRVSVSVGEETIEVVWVPRFTPSRVPLFDQRWTTAPPSATGILLVDQGADLPTGREAGVRWAHVGALLEYSVSFFDGFNHLPIIDARLRPAPSIGAPAPVQVELTRTYPAIRTYGADAAVPTRWFTLKGEAAYFTSPDASTDEYVLYAVQLERQSGEWLFVGGYAGEVLTAHRAPMTFAPDRGMARSIVARASYTIDSNRSLAVEAVARQNGRGVYAKVEYSQARGEHWRITLTSVALAGQSDDFLGQYRRDSHAALALRYSF